jgi:hypothetical protein|tara:strand:- start:102 stop:1001 length:900 start_codon:yes stop_codon:yes gene_type:complete
MPELAEVQTKKTAGFVDRGYNYEKRQQRMKAEEEEIKRLEAEARGETPVDEEPKQEVTQEEEANTEAKEDTLSAEERTFKKRYGDLRRHVQQKEKEWEEKFSALEKRSEREGIVPPKSDEDIDNWAKQYPDVAGIVETIATKKAQEMFEKANIRIKEIDEERMELKRDSAENVIRKAHSDFDDLRAADEFHNWAEQQPKWVKDALYENSDDPDSVIRVIDLYKMDNGLTVSDKKKNTKNAAKTVARKSKTEVDLADANNMIKESDVAKMSNEEFAEKSDEINAALRSGKFIYDISGSAR